MAQRALLHQVAPHSAAAEEAIFRARLISKEQTLKQIAKLFVLFSKGIIANDTQANFSNYEGLAQKVALYELGMRRLNGVVEANERETDNYKRLHSEMGPPPIRSIAAL